MKDKRLILGVIVGILFTLFVITPVQERIEAYKQRPILERGSDWFVTLVEEF